MYLAVAMIIVTTKKDVYSLVKVLTSYNGNVEANIQVAMDLLWEGTITIAIINIRIPNKNTETLCIV